MTPTLDRILIYPIKSLDGVSVQSAKIMPGGSLESDREFALFDAANKVVNAKRTAKIQQLRSQFDLARRTVQISIQGSNPATFQLDHEQAQLAQWLSDYFGFAVHLQQDRTTGFPDDLQSPGPTIISTATLDQVSQWFAGSTTREMRDRFRTNLEFRHTAAFWEDRLFGPATATIGFKIGTVQFEGVNPCLRCIVPTRHPITTAVTANFTQAFAAQRQDKLPSWADVSRFKPFYRLATNTRIPRSEVGKTLQVGDVFAG
jgi:uncharacterized protein